MSCKTQFGASGALDDCQSPMAVARIQTNAFLPSTVSTTARKLDGEDVGLPRRQHDVECEAK